MSSEALKTLKEILFINPTLFIALAGGLLVYELANAYQKHQEEIRRINEEADQEEKQLLN